MKLNDIIRTIPKFLVGMGQQNKRCSIELISAPGRGKSQVTRRIREECQKLTPGKEWGFQTVFLATQSPVDLPGMTFKGVMEYRGKRITVADPTMPVWMLTEDGFPVTEFESGILFLDEFGQAEGDTKKAAAELLLNGQIGKWKLPPGWHVIAASNRASDRSGVTKNFDFVVNRRMELHIDDDIDGLIAHAEKSNVHPLVLAFMRVNPTIVLDPKGIPEQQGPYCTPRTAFMVSDLLYTLAGDSIDVRFSGPIHEMVGGLIGPAAAAQMENTVRLAQELPPLEAILAAPGTTQVPQSPHAQMLACYRLAAIADEANFGKLITYVSRMPKEFSCTFMQAATNRDMDLLDTHEFDKWVDDNRDLLDVVTRAV